MFPLLNVVEAQQHLLNAIQRLEVERISLGQAAGRILAKDITASFNQPTFDNSSMDGFAVKAADVTSARPEQPVVLEVIADIPAGFVSSVSLSPGQAARIMTGAPLPAGADAVVPVESTDHYLPGRTPQAQLPLRVNIFEPVKEGDYIRFAGQDFTIGEKILHSGKRLLPQDVGLLAMLGMAEIRVFRQPRVAVLSSGDELLPVGAPLALGKLYDSNGVMLAALVQQSGGVAIRLGVAADRREVVQELLDRAVAEKVDLILSSAGVSVGAYDYLREVVEQKGNLVFWRVDMRPGKPIAFGNYQQLPFIGLPGNPVSAFMGYWVFVHPVMLQMQGYPPFKRKIVMAQLTEAITSDGRESYLRGMITEQDGRFFARLVGHQGSGNLLSLTRANALLIIPSGVKSLPLGAEVEAWILAE
jgi:molybdopterin molybdotransferase